MIDNIIFGFNYYGFLLSLEDLFLFVAMFFQVYRINVESAKIARRAANDVAEATGM